MAFFWWHALFSGQVAYATGGESQSLGVGYLGPMTIVRWRYAFAAHGTVQFEAETEIDLHVPPQCSFFAGYDPTGGHLGSDVNPYVDNEFDYAVLDDCGGTTEYVTDLSGTGWRSTFNMTSGPRRNSEAKRSISPAHPHPFAGFWVNQNVGADLANVYNIAWWASLSILYQTLG